jgi:uncharacterized protein (TIGR00661 family)
VLHKKILNNGMESSLAQKKGQKLRILVAPLDWGLGHATRCIPIINELLLQGCEVLLAAEGKQKELLSIEFPALTILPLQGYRVQYAKSKTALFWKILLQIPGLIRKIQKEYKWLQAIVQEYNIDAVISDNRYGLYHSYIPTVFITHQLQIKTGIAKWADKLLQKRIYKLVNRFSQCWVPDNKVNGLAGELSHPNKLPRLPVHYLNPISRFQPNDVCLIEDHLLILLSGPEPQRTLLEEKIVNEIAHYDGTATIVRGLPGSETLIPSTNMIKFYNHLSAHELNKEMLQAAYIVARSGYTTIMDVAALQKKSILIPTPGQTEQEYLADYLSQKKWAISISQQNFKLKMMLDEASKLSYRKFENNANPMLKQVVTAFVESLIKP